MAYYGPNAEIMGSVKLKIWHHQNVIDDIEAFAINVDCWFACWSRFHQLHYQWLYYLEILQCQSYEDVAQNSKTILVCDDDLRSLHTWNSKQFRYFQIIYLLNWYPLFTPRIFLNSCLEGDTQCLKTSKVYRRGLHSKGWVGFELWCKYNSEHQFQKNWRKEQKVLI